MCQTCGCSPCKTCGAEIKKAVCAACGKPAAQCVCAKGKAKK